MTIDNIWNFDLKIGNSHNPKDGACLMDAVSWFEYGTLGDHPDCTCDVIAAYCRSVNDLMTDAGRQKLKAFIPRLIGTKDNESRAARAEYLIRQAVRVFTPFWLDKAEMKDEAKQLREFAGNLDEAVGLIKTIRSAAYAYAYAYAASATAYASATSATYAAYAYAAYASADSAAYAAYASADYAASAASTTYAAYAAFTASADYAASAEWELLILEALDGVLKIGKQAEPIVVDQITRANDTFRRARENAYD